MNQLPSHAKIKLIEDDELLALTVSETLERQGYRVESFQSLKSFQEHCNCEEDAIFIADYRIGKESGMDAIDWILRFNPFHVIIFTTSYGDLQTGAEAVKQGAFDVLDKPFTVGTMLQKIELATRELEARAKDRDTFRRYQRIMQILSFGEKKVFQFMLAGTANKVIASELNVSLRTVEMRRSKILKAFSVNSLPELVTLYCKLSNNQRHGDALLLQNVM